ncbi:MAG TPA: hypothetical protein VN247_02285, partial [Arenimonas sp.]|nr:hypothetical protein [Arenimonas sp.]
QESMSPEQFKAAGLNKLSKTELENLNAWISGQKTVVVEKIVAVEVEKPEVPKEDIVSAIVGEFKGWRGNTRFTLENGQVWEQADTSELFANKIMNPKVRIVHSGFSGWKLQVEGYNKWVKVKQVK